MPARHGEVDPASVSVLKETELDKMSNRLTCGCYPACCVLLLGSLQKISLRRTDEHEVECRSVSGIRPLFVLNGRTCPDLK
jgi:hypothetical protein